MTNQEQLNQTENNMPPKKKKSQKDAKKAIANMGANLGVMMSGASPQTDSHSVNADGTEIGLVETTLSPVLDNSPVTNLVQDAKVQSAESAECNDIPETETPSEPVGRFEMDPPTPVEVNIDIEKTQGNAIYSSLVGIQSTLDNFELDVKKDSLREVVSEAIKQATKAHWDEITQKEKKEADRLREKGQPGTPLELHQAADQRMEELRQLDIHHMEQYNTSNKVIHDRLCELLGRANLYPLERPKFKDEKGHILLKSLYQYPRYCCLRVYFDNHVGWFFKTLAWSIWLICIGLLFFIVRDNAILQKQQNINRYVHAYFSDNDEVMMELEGIDLMFSDQDVMPMPIKDYREYMKERKKEAKDKAKTDKRK